MNITIIITSPLHMLIALILCRSNPENKYSLVFTGKNHDRNKKFQESINSLKIDNIMHVDLVRLKTKKDVVTFLGKYTPDEIITGNDVIHEFAITSYIANKKNILLSYLDDGLFSYNEYTPKKESLTWLKNAFRLAVKGYKRQKRHTIGSSPLTKKAYLFLPDKAKPSLQNKTIIKIGTSKETMQFIIRCAPAFLKEYQEHVNNDIDAIICIPRISNGSTTIDNINNYLTSCAKKNQKVRLKNHPNNDKSILQGMEEITLPSHIPAEILFALIKPKKIFVSDSSVGFITQLLLPEIEIYSMEELINII